MNIFKLISEHPRSIANEALYYCIRAIKQAGLSGNSKKDPFHDTGMSKPSAEAIALADKILSEIVRIEKQDLDHIDKHRIGKYISIVGKASVQLAESDSKINKENGINLLRKMREI